MKLEISDSEFLDIQCALKSWIEVTRPKYLPPTAHRIRILGLLSKMEDAELAIRVERGKALLKGDSDANA